MKLPLKYSQYKTKHMFSSKIQVGKDSYIDMPIGMRLLFSFLFAISLLVSNYIISLFQLPSLAEAFNRRGTYYCNKAADIFDISFSILVGSSTI